MQMTRLDHVNIRTCNLAEMINWYTNVLGLKNGDRPDYGFPGAWLYIGDQAVIHLVSVDKECISIAPKIEHFALSATGFADCIRALDQNGVAYSVDPVPGIPVVQVNVADFDGNHIHIDFGAADVEAL